MGLKNYKTKKICLDEFYQPIFFIFSESLFTEIYCPMRGQYFYAYSKARQTVFQIYGSV